jgi:FMN phosphatase YigB (HAD superfamily)
MKDIFKQLNSETMKKTDHRPAFHIAELDSITAVFDIDDTVFDPNEDFEPDYINDGTSYVILDGTPVQLNPLFRKPTGDNIVNAREAFGPLDENGTPLGRRWDRLCKVDGKMSFEEHLKRQIEEVLERITLEQWIEFCIKTLVPKRGVLQFMSGLRERGVAVVFVTNGADTIATAVLRHFFDAVLEKLIVYANLLRNGVFSGAHGSVGIAKGEVVLSLGRVQFFFGDSKGGDGPGAKAVWDAGGFVFSLGHDGSSSLMDYCRHHFGDTRWQHLNDYTEAEATVHEHLTRINKQD